MRMALTVGRVDFWNIGTERRTDELTPCEELYWRVYETIEPWGERRADIRSAMSVLHLVQSQCTKKLTGEQIDKIYSSLTGYLKSEDEEKKITPDESARACKAAFAAYGK